MPAVDLVYDSGCPNVGEARAQLMRAFAQAKIHPTWHEWRGDDPESPERVRGYGSPTILVGGQDVASGTSNGGACCRLYGQPDGGIRGVPGVDAIAAALEKLWRTSRPQWPRPEDPPRNQPVR